MEYEIHWHIEGEPDRIEVLRTWNEVMIRLYSLFTRQRAGEPIVVTYWPGC